MRLLFYISALAILFICPSGVCAQAPGPSSEIVRLLLSAPAPTPRTAETSAETKKPRPSNFFDKNTVPADDAPLEDLVEYWTRWAHNTVNKHFPSVTVRQRLLDGSVDDLQRLFALLPLFTSSEDEVEKIKQAFDQSENNPQLESQRQQIKNWLVFNSKYFIGELLSLANKVKDKKDEGYVENESALMALAKIDWIRAQPLLETLVNTGQQRTSALALTLLYQHSIKVKDLSAEMKFRSELQSIASNRNFPGYARDAAIEALSTSEWSGRDEWYLSLFNDASLIALDDGHHGFSSLSTLFSREPEKWIPVMTKLVAGKDRTQQQAAASCLARYANNDPRRDVILPVLRWLTDPDWIPISGTERAWFIQTMDEADVPESIPGLIWIVENDEDSRQWAARTLAHYKDARAIPALKKALAEASESEQPYVLEGLVASGGLTEAEQVDALEAYATKLTTESGREEVVLYRSYGEKLPLPVSIGRYLANVNSAPETLIPAVIRRATQLRTRNPALSRSLMEIVHRWQSRQVDIDLIKRIAANTAEANTIIAALERRTKLRETVEPELRLLLVASGMPQGIGVILLEDNAMAASILDSSDQWAQIGLLASARLTQTPLPIDQVGPLLKSKNSLLSTAAESYLLAEDSKKARTLLLLHHPNEAFITGWRENIQLIGGNNFDPIGKYEEKLRAELLKTGGPLEIFALLPNYEYHSRVLRIYADKAVYTHYEDSSRYRERVVPKDELSVFKQSVSTSGITDVGPQFGSCHHNCRVSEFVTLSRAAGRRVFSHVGFESMMDTVLANLDRLGAGATTHYNLEKEIKGLEVLYADQSLTVLDVWKHDDDIRIFVELAQTDEQEDRDTDDQDDKEDDNAQALRRHQEFVRLKALFSWRSLKEKKAGSITTVPDGYSTYDESKFPFDENDVVYRDERQVQVLTPESILLAKNSDGLWKQVAGTKAVRIGSDEGAYANPIVTPDGKWAVVAKTDSHWATPNYLVRFNLETGREYRVKLEAADELDPIAFLPVHGKILLRRAKDDPEVLSGRSAARETAEYYLIDPKTGAVAPVSGEFAPLRHEGKRFLQSAGELGQYWAAIPDETKNQTQVGRYNLKDFSFKPILTVPHIAFDSMSMWVDEKGGRLYVVYKGQLLRLPLKSE